MNNKMYKRLTLPALLLSALFLMGCATSFQQNNLASVDAFPKVNTSKSIAVDLAFSGKLNGKPWTDNDVHNTAFLKQTCIKHMNDSGMFGTVSGGRKSSDLNLQVAIINEKIANPNEQFWTGLTLFIIPYKSIDTFRLGAVVTNNKTGQQKKFRFEESVSYYQQLFLAPLSLFKSHDKGLEQCRERLFDNLCMEIQKSGMLK